MMRNMTRFITLIFFLFLSTLANAAEPELLHANEWLLPKKATTILDMPAIHKSMLKMQAQPQSVLSLKYPGGDEGTLWVYELRSWLVTLGLSSSRIKLKQGSAISTTIEFVVLLPQAGDKNLQSKEKI